MTIHDDSFVPDVDPAVWRLRPDFSALSIVVRGVSLSPDAVLADRPTPPAPPWADAHFDAWRQAYAAFGAKPQRTPSSAEALRRRVERDGALPHINALVDLYNELSLRYAIPIGGEDIAAYRGRPRLVRATGGERFETMRDGQPWIETVEPGEVIWRDDQGVTCRRWNWRQSVRTRLESSSRDMWFVLERLEPMPLAGLQEAADVLMRELQRLAPGAAMTSTLLAP